MFCPHCGNQTATTPNATTNFCTACGAAVSPNAAAHSQPRLVRPLHPRMIVGVCSGIALHFGWDVALVRIALIIIALCTHGCAVLFYIAAWILIPSAIYAMPAPPPPFARTTA